MGDINAAAAAECQKAVAVLENRLQNKKHSGREEKEYLAGGKEVPNQMFREMNMKMPLGGISDTATDLCEGCRGGKNK